MTPARERLLSTIRALMEMTEARGCTRAEAAIASAKARQLMDKHGVGLKDLAPSAGITGARAPAKPRQEPSQRPRAYESGNNAFANEVFAGKGRRSWTWEPFRCAGRVLAGYAAVGFGIWAIAAFHITPSQQDHPYRYGREVSNGEEPILSRDFSSQDWAEISKSEQEHDGLPTVRSNRREAFRSEDRSDPAMIGSREGQR
jgi:Protein of unknown function (DUF2786)